jgi:hypothetical protein
MGFFVVSTREIDSRLFLFLFGNRAGKRDANPLFAVAGRRETIVRDANDPEDEKVKTLFAPRLRIWGLLRDY